MSNGMKALQVYRHHISPNFFSNCLKATSAELLEVGKNSISFRYGCLVSISLHHWYMHDSIEWSITKPRPCSFMLYDCISIAQQHHSGLGLGFGLGLAILISSILSQSISQVHRSRVRLPQKREEAEDHDRKRCPRCFWRAEHCWIVGARQEGSPRSVCEPEHTAIASSQSRGIHWREYLVREDR